MDDMNADMQQTAAAFAEDPPREIAQNGGDSSDALLLHLDSYEGPIDVLLQLARDQKVDLAQISILQLVRQYLAFIDRAKQLSLDIAAEYLVMAAWLAYLKSRLLLPKQEQNEEEPSAEMMAEALAYQLRRLEGVQLVAGKLAKQMRRNLTVYGRGARETFHAPEPDKYAVDLYQLLKAYGDITKRKTSSQYRPITFPVMSMEDALERMTKMLGRLPKSGTSSVWTTLSSFLPERIANPLYGKSSLASLLTASLELAKQGKVELRQDALYRPIYLRAVDHDPIDSLSSEPDEQAIEEIEEIIEHTTTDAKLEQEQNDAIN
jgi:segregation and condensation protein A